MGFENIPACLLATDPVFWQGITVYLGGGEIVEKKIWGGVGRVREDEIDGARTVRRGRLPFEMRKLRVAPNAVSLSLHYSKLLLSIASVPVKSQGNIYLGNKKKAWNGASTFCVSVPSNNALLI